MSGEERLQKIIAAAGIASRRKAEELIRAGRVTVNGCVTTQLGSKADPARDHIKVDGRLITRFASKVYLMLNKPRQVICTVSDPQGRTKVTDIVRSREKLYPVGRLDYNTEGLIILTNDGEFARIVSSAGEHLPKVYEVKVRSCPDEGTLGRLRSGIRLRDGTQLAPCRIAAARQGKNCWLEVILTQGRNREIRNMFEEAGHPVMRLRRVRIGFLSIRGLPLGHYRSLTPSEVERIMGLSRRRPGSPNDTARPRERRR